MRMREKCYCYKCKSNKMRVKVHTFLLIRFILNYLVCKLACKSTNTYYRGYVSVGPKDDYSYRNGPMRSSPPALDIVPSGGGGGPRPMQVFFSVFENFFKNPTHLKPRIKNENYFLIKCSKGQ